jgi:hypothetical protein
MDSPPHFLNFPSNFLCKPSRFWRAAPGLRRQVPLTLTTPIRPWRREDRCSVCIVDANVRQLVSRRNLCLFRGNLGMRPIHAGLRAAGSLRLTGTLALAVPNHVSISHVFRNRHFPPVFIRRHGRCTPSPVKNHIRQIWYVCSGGLRDLLGKGRHLRREFPSS